MPDDRPLSACEKISILEREYDTLRAEVISRTSNCYQLVAAGGAGAAFLMNLPANLALWTSAAILAIAFLGLFWALYRDINGLAHRISQIEQRINFLAGDDLLEWETLWGGGANGWFPPKRRRKEGLPAARDSGLGSY